MQPPTVNADYTGKPKYMVMDNDIADVDKPDRIIPYKMGVTQIETIFPNTDEYCGCIYTQKLQVTPNLSFITDTQPVWSLHVPDISQVDKAYQQTPVFHSEDESVLTCDKEGNMLPASSDILGKTAKLSITFPAAGDLYEEMKFPIEIKIANDNDMPISSKADWDKFCSMVTDGKQTSLNGHLTANITEGVTTMAGNKSIPYKGAFDGKFHTLTVSYNTSSQCSAPFPVVDGATIKNLNVDGMITTSAKFAAGIAGIAQGHKVNISGCTSSVDINSTVNGDGTHGGIISVTNIETDIKDCGFKGSINGNQTSCCAGILGWRDKTTRITNCYVAAKYLVGSQNSCTIVRNGANLDHVYYLNALGEVQGTKITEEQLNSGELAWMLQQGRSETIWGQEIGVDKRPYTTDNNDLKVNKVQFRYNNNIVYTKYANKTLKTMPTPKELGAKANEQKFTLNGNIFSQNSIIDGDIIVDAKDFDAYFTKTIKVITRAGEVDFGDTTIKTPYNHISFTTDDGFTITLDNYSSYMVYHYNQLDIDKMSITNSKYYIIKAEITPTYGASMIIEPDEEKGFELSNFRMSTLVMTLSHRKLLKLMGDDSFTGYVGDQTNCPPVSPAYKGKITYTSSNPSVATVDKNGKVTLKARGQAQIIMDCNETDDYNARQFVYQINIPGIKIVDNHVNIASREDWEDFVMLTSNGFGDLDATLTNDIDIVTNVKAYYSGVFDGQNHTITMHLQDVPALFEEAESPIIKNLVLEGTVKNSKELGGVVWYNEIKGKRGCTTISNVIARQTMTSSIKEYQYSVYFGGIVTRNLAPLVIENCEFSGYIDTGGGEPIGAYFLSTNYNWAKITNCLATGSLSTKWQNYCNPISYKKAEISNCYYTVALQNQNAGAELVTAEQLRNGYVLKGLGAGWGQSMGDARPQLFNPSLTVNDDYVYFDENADSWRCKRYVFREQTGLPEIAIDMKMGKASYKRDVNVGGWYTLCLPFNFKADDNMKYFSDARIEGDYVYLKEIPTGTVMEPGTPLIVLATKGVMNIEETDADYSPESKTVEGDFFTLHGSYEQKVFHAADEAPLYYISSDKFWHATDRLTVLPFRAYLTLNEQKAAARSFFIGMDETTDIDTATLPDMNESNIYQLNGNKVGQLQHGLNIVRLKNGKTIKIIIK